MNRHVRTFLVGPSLPRSLTAVAVLLGDLLVLLAFVAAGIYSHGGYPWKIPEYTLETLAPFLVAWLVVAPLVGAYHRETLTDYRRTVAVVALAWLVASALGALIRATSLFHGGAPPSFVLANALLGAAFLLPWRIASAGLCRLVGR